MAARQPYESLADIESDGGEATFVEADVSEPDKVEAMVETAVDIYDSLDFAHNNAGIGSPVESTKDMAIDEWDEVMNVNLRGVWLCMREKLRHMARNGGGAIINTSSAAGILGEGHLPHYPAAKHGVIGLTKTTAFEFAEEGIRINAVNPGVILTGLPDPDSKFVAVLINVTPMGRTAQLEEVGDVVVRLCSEEASFITGVPLPIDGGSLNGRA